MVRIGDVSETSLTADKGAVNIAASLEKNEEKADQMLQQATGIDDQKGMQGYMDRSKVRDVVGTKFMRELVLK